MAIEGDVVAEGELGLEGIGRGFEGEGGADFGRTEGRVLKGNLAVESHFLQSPNAELTPAGDGHGLDQHELGCGGGAEFLDEGAEEFEETGRGFFLEYDGAGEEAVTEAVTG